MTIGHYVVADNDNRVHTTAYFDGRQWWLPGSTLAFEPSDFEGAGRFSVVSQIDLPVAIYGHWEVEMGQYK